MPREPDLSPVYRQASLFSLETSGFFVYTYLEGRWQAGTWNTVYQIEGGTVYVVFVDTYV